MCGCTGNSYFWIITNTRRRSLSKEGLRLPAKDSLLRFRDQLGMLGEVVLSRLDDLTMRVVLWFEALRSRLSLRCFDRAPLRHDPDRSAHRLALGIAYRWRLLVASSIFTSGLVG